MPKKLLAILILIVVALSFPSAALAYSFNFRTRPARLTFQEFVNRTKKTSEPSSTTTAIQKPSSTPRPTRTPRPTPTATSTPTSTPTSQPSPIGAIGGPSQPTNGFTRGLVTLTLDDASQTQYLNGWPIMQKYGMRATFYMTTGSLDGFWYMTPQQISALHNAGNHIAAHTLTHPDLTTISADQLTHELADPQTYLQNLVGISVRDFASPYGLVNSNVLTQILKYYRSHRGVQEGFNTKANFNLANILVQNVENSTSAAQITTWVNEAKANNSWLVLVYHEVKANPDQWSTSPGQFDSHLNAIKNSGVTVSTLNQAINELLPQL